MIKGIQLILLGILWLPVGIVGADEPPDDTIAQQIMEESGFIDLTPGEELSVGALLEAELVVKSERLSYSNVEVIKTTEKYAEITGVDPPVAMYEEIVTINVRGKPVKYARQLPPEEAQRREAEASGLSLEQYAEGLRGYGEGLMMVGQALQDKMMANERFGPLLNGVLGHGGEGAGVLDVEDPAGIGEADNCEQLIQAATRYESDSATAGNDGERVEVQPWTSINPVTFMMGPACMVVKAADVFEAVDDFDDETKERIGQAMEEALAEINFAGFEDIDGHRSYRLRLEDLNLTQSAEPVAGVHPGTRHNAFVSEEGPAQPGISRPGIEHISHRRDAMESQVYGERNGVSAVERVPAVFYYEPEDAGQFQGASEPNVYQVAQSQGGAGGGTGAGTAMTINSVDIWIDAEYLVRRKMRMEGAMEEDGQSREFFMERLYQDYRNVPNSALYEPYKTVLRAGGVLGEAQQAELREAQAQLEELEREMAEMPASQRAMMENMMGGQMERLRSLTSGGAVEFEIITTSIEINPDFRNPMIEEFARGASGGAAPSDLGGNLLQTIQVDLTTLGYEPGNTEGVLDTMTQVAISQFQAEQGLQVTGEPSTDLASALAAAVAGQ